MFFMCVIFNPILGNVWANLFWTGGKNRCRSVIFGPIHLIFLQMIGKDSTYMIWLNLLILG